MNYVQLGTREIERESGREKKHTKLYWCTNNVGVQESTVWHHCSYSILWTES